MAELITIARPYAEAAFRLARENNALPAWLSMLRLVGAVVADREMAAALDNPKLTAENKEALVLSVCGDQLDPLGRNFVRVLIGSDRVDLLPQIAALFENLKNAAEGVAEATIESVEFLAIPGAHTPLEEAQLASRATDAQLSGLVSAGNATGSASMSATATAGVTNAAGNVAGSVAGSTAAGAGAAATGALGVGKGSTNAGVTGTATAAAGGLVPKH